MNPERLRILIHSGFIQVEDNQTRLIIASQTFGSLPGFLTFAEAWKIIGMAVEKFVSNPPPTVGGYYERR